MRRILQFIFGLTSVIAIQLSLRADVLPIPDSPFKGKIGLSAKDSIPDWPQPVTAPKGAPNIVLILLDDAGFAATGTFGGPAQTPALDKLAAEGLRYNRFHVTATCAPTRASLLSGRNHHRVGFGMVMDAGDAGYPGYSGRWPKSAATIAQVLRLNGYSTSAFGKWHNTPLAEVSPVGPFDRWPTGLGFEYFYGVIPGAGDWEPALYRNTIPVEPPKSPEQGYHLTSDLADDAIRWMQTHTSLAQEKPYFIYFAPMATIVPHHVPEEWIEKYRGDFDQGWDNLRQEIFVRQKALGVIPADTQLTPRSKELPAWRSFSAEKRKFLSRQMEVYAGFMSHTDHEIGRLINAVRQAPGGDNTLVLFIGGDNGADVAGGGFEGRDNWGAPPQSDQERLKNLQELGGPEHLNNYASGWGWAMNTPFQWGKTVGSHFGGTRDPLVVSWPKRIKDRGGLRSQFTHIIDVAPTIYEVTKVSPPSKVHGVEQLPLDGVSFANSFDHPQVASNHRVQYFEMLGSRALYADGWVAAARHGFPWMRNDYTDFIKDRWELYHLDQDFSQTKDLAQRHPQKLMELKHIFEEEALKNDVYPLGGFADESHSNWYETWNVNAKCENRPWIYYPSLPRLPTFVAPYFGNSHRIVVEAAVPEEGAQGVLISNGSRYGGFSFYIKDNHLVYENNAFGMSHDVIVSATPVPYGLAKLTYEFESAGAQDKGGIGRLYINGVLEGEGRISNITSGPPLFYGTFNIGRTRVSPVSDAYSLPFAFTGELQKLTIQNTCLRR